MVDVKMAKKNHSDTKPFSELWWKEFIHLNQNFTQPIVINNVLIDYSVQLWRDLQICLDKRIQLEFKDFDSFNLYTDGHLTSFDECSAFFADVMNNGQQDIFSHLQSRSESCSYGLVLNCCEQFSEELLKTLHNITAPLSTVAGMPVCGLDSTIFIGNYGWTPLGIHQDQPGENVLHLHLGPGDKTMYVWQEDDYQRLIKKYYDTPPANMTDKSIIEALLPAAEVLHFKAGDLYYMPWDNYHIGYTPELSYGITIWFNSATEKQLALNLIENMKLNISAQDRDHSIQPRLTPDNGLDVIQRHKHYLSAHEKVSDYITSNFKDYRNKIDSNGGWRFFPYSRSELSEETFNDVNWQESLFCCTLPFKILCFPAAETVTLYLRGTRIMFRSHPEMEKLIISLNNGDVLSGAEICQRLDPWPESVVNYLLKMMHNYRAIEIKVKDL